MAFNFNLATGPIFGVHYSRRLGWNWSLRQCRPSCRTTIRGGVYRFGRLVVTAATAARRTLSWVGWAKQAPGKLGPRPRLCHADSETTTAWGDALSAACPSPVDGHATPDLSPDKMLWFGKPWAMTGDRGHPDGPASLCPSYTWREVRAHRPRGG